MNKKYLTGILLIIICFLVVGCGKKPGTASIFIPTKNGINKSETDSMMYVSVKEKIVQVGKNTSTDKKTGETTEYEYTNVEYEITALKEGKTTLVLEYIDPKTNESKKDIYIIEVNKDLEVTYEKQ